MKARLYTKYVNDVVPALKAKHNYSNVHQIPRIEKIVVNMGISASLEKGAIEDAAKDLTMITGRKPAISKSRHAIANFKLRENQPGGRSWRVISSTSRSSVASYSPTAPRTVSALSSRRGMI